METLTPAQPLPHNHQSAGVISTPDSQPPPANTADPSQTAAAGPKPHLQYRCLLNQHAQKLRKPPPVYQTQNEGSEHLPRFRTTVWVDGVSYTSSNTFQQRKASETDASKLAYIAITQKAKTDALHFIQQEKIFCKSVLAEFAAKKNMGKLVYETTKLEASVPVFRSYLHFNGVTYQGDCGKSKKEAEQLVACSVIIQYLESEFGTDMADVVYCKLRKYYESTKVRDINTMQGDSNVLGAQAGVGHNYALTELGSTTMAKSSAAPESSLVQGTMVPTTFPSAGVPQPIIPQLLVEPITPAAPVVIQPPAQQASAEPVNLSVPLVTQPAMSHVSTEPIHPVVPVVTQQPTPQVSVEPIKPSVAEPLVLTPIPSVVVNTSHTSIVSAPLVENSATTNVVQESKPGPSPSQTPEYIPLVDQASDKKRSRTSRRNARKKMRADAQMPVIPATNHGVPFSSQ